MHSKIECNYPISIILREKLNINFCLLLLLLVLVLLFGVCCARPGESEYTLSVQRLKPHTTNPWKEEEDKTVGDKKEKADLANRKALALFLKPAVPHHQTQSH